MSSRTVSVVVTAWSYETRHELAECIAAIGRQTRPPGETIVAIDHNPELAAWARDSLPSVKVAENRHESGVVGNRNTGLEASGGEIVVFTDDDTCAEPEWLEKINELFADPEVVGVTGELVPKWSGPEPRWFPTELYWVLGCSYTGLPTVVAPVRNPIGANMAVRREAILAVGGFEVGAPPRALSHRGTVVSGGHALDDTSLGIRVGRARPGKKWLYQPAAVVHHNVNAGRATFDYLIRRSYEEGQSKAVLAATFGSEIGLESERRHLLVVVPKGLGRGLRDLLAGDPAGPARSFCLLAGVIAVAAGYLVTAVRLRAGPPATPDPS